jgi:hypothetical protein
MITWTSRSSHRAAGKPALRASHFGALGCIVFTLLGALSCSGDDHPLQVALSSRLFAGTNSQAGCGQLQSSWIQVGDVDTGVRIEDGHDDQGTPVGIQCSVKSTGGGNFAVNAAIDRSANGCLPDCGGVSVVGTFSSSGQSTGITATFTRGDTGTFTGTDCTATFPDNGGVRAGAVWAKVSCTKVENDGAGPTPQVCAAETTFRFENCSQ